MAENIESIQNLPHFKSIFYSFRAQMSHRYIIRNAFLDTKQWAFSFKKQCTSGAKILNFRVSELRLISKYIFIQSKQIYTQ